MSDLAQGRIAKTTTNIYFEAGQDVAGISAEDAELKVRRFDSFCSDSDVLLRAAMSPRLHLALDQLVGEGRTLFQEMTLVKPPEIGAPKALHQDASCFLLKDPSLCIGTWTALDPATLENGCLQMIPGSHPWGPTPHVHETLADCHIRAEDSRPDAAVPLPMNAGDTVIFNGLLHHFSAFNRSTHRRRALQFHFAQDGAVWGSDEDHRRLFHDQNGHYAGCVKGNDARIMDILTGRRQRKVLTLDSLPLA